MAAALVIIGLMAFAVAQLGAAAAASWWLAGALWPWCLLALLAIAGRPLPLALAAFVGALGPWHWGWGWALLLAVPQAFTFLPGLVAAGIARWRHG